MKQKYIIFFVDFLEKKILKHFIQFSLEKIKIFSYNEHDFRPVHVVQVRRRRRGSRRLWRRQKRATGEPRGRGEDREGWEEKRGCEGKRRKQRQRHREEYGNVSKYMIYFIIYNLMKLFNFILNIKNWWTYLRRGQTRKRPKTRSPSIWRSCSWRRVLDWTVTRPNRVPETSERPSKCNFTFLKLPETIIIQVRFSPFSKNCYSNTTKLKLEKNLYEAKKI